MQVVLNIITILAFVISLYNLFYQIVHTRRNVDIIVNCVISRAATPYWFVLDLAFINKSVHPISIYAIQIIVDKSIYFITKDKKVLTTTTSRSGREVISIEKIHSQELPFEIQGYLSLPGKFILDLSSNEQKLQENQEYSLVIYTSRGKIKKKITINTICDLEQVL